MSTHDRTWLSQKTPGRLTPEQADAWQRQLAADALRYESDGSGLAALLTGVVIGFTSACFFGGLLWVLS